MKRIAGLSFFIILSVFLPASHLYAQWNVGLLGGAGISTWTVRDVPELITPFLPSDYKIKSSFYFGGYVNFTLSDLIDISPEFFYAGRGRKMVYTSWNYKFNVSTNTFALPVLIRIKVPKKLQFYTGPEFSYIIREKARETSQGINFSNTRSEKPFDIAITAGLSFKVITNLFINIRYNFGLLDQTKTYFIPGEMIGPNYTGQQVPVDYKAFNRSFQVGLNYSFLNRK